MALVVFPGMVIDWEFRTGYVWTRQAADAFFPVSGEENKHHNTATPAPPAPIF
jgi:hypothetical protein